MNRVEKKMLDLLKDLKENHCVIAIKAEFEAEGSRTEELVKLNEVVFRANMDLYIKIGGCEAVRDLDQCRLLGATGIMAPMIETKFAMSKFIGAIRKVFTKEEIEDIKFIINTETITCFENIDEIFNVEGIELIHSIAVGRVDLSGSMGLSRDEINGDKVFNITKLFLEKAIAKGIVPGMGGGITQEAIPFIKKLGNLVEKFETRKVVFKNPEALSNINEGLVKAMEFELLYLKNKYDFYNRMAQEDIARMKMMEARLSQIKGNS